MKTISKIIPFIIVILSIFSAKGQTPNLQAVTNAANTTTLPITVHSSVYLGRGPSTGATNIAIGNSLNAASSTASDNTGIGFNNLSSITSGSLNVAVGNSALQQMTGGSGNSAYGCSSMRGASTFSSVTYNCGFGGSALEYITNNGTYNAAFGYQALKGISSGKYNVGIGGIAGFSLTGDSNTVAGFSSGYNVTGNGNVIVGASAGAGAMTGSRNLILGYGANVNDVTLSNQLSIQNVIYGRNMTKVSSTITGNIGIGIIPTPYSGSNYSKLYVAGNTTTEPSLQLQGVPTDAGSFPVPNPTGTGKYLFVDASGIVTQAGLPLTAACSTQYSVPVFNATGNLVVVKFMIMG